MGRLTQRHKAVRITLGGDTRRAMDTVAAEEPLQIRIGGEPFTVTMRLPGHDVELAHGLLRAEGVIRTREDVISARFCADLDSLNVLEMMLANPAPAAISSTRNLASFGGCGLCGTTAVDAIETVLHERPPETFWEAADILAALEELRTRQPVFAKTGGTHAAGLVVPSEASVNAQERIAVVREDVGRHNAVDKVLGWALTQDVSASGALLVVSSRASFEIVHKAAMAGVSVLACVSAPSSLAIEAAERLGVCLVAFARGRSLSAWTQTHRITTS